MELTTQPSSLQSRSKSTPQYVGGVSLASMKWKSLVKRPQRLHCPRQLMGVDARVVLGDPGSRVANGVGPGGNASQVVLSIVPEEIFEVGGRLLLHEVASDIGDGDVPQA